MYTTITLQTLWTFYINTQKAQVEFQDCVGFSSEASKNQEQDWKSRWIAGELFQD